jgi:hypothetical protein
MLLDALHRVLRCSCRVRGAKLHRRQVRLVPVMVPPHPSGLCVCVSALCRADGVCPGAQPTLAHLPNLRCVCDTPRPSRSIPTNGSPLQVDATPLPGCTTLTQDEIGACPPHSHCTHALARHEPCVPSCTSRGPVDAPPRPAPLACCSLLLLLLLSIHMPLLLAAQTTPAPPCRHLTT